MATENTQEAGIGISDLAAMASILDLAVKRGAFNANEMSQVGAVYDKLSATLAQIAEAQKAAKAEAPEEKAEEA